MCVRTGMAWSSFFWLFIVMIGDSLFCRARECEELSVCSIRATVCRGQLIKDGARPHADYPWSEERRPGGSLVSRNV